MKRISQRPIGHKAGLGLVRRIVHLPPEIALHGQLDLDVLGLELPLQMLDDDVLALLL